MKDPSGCHRESEGARVEREDLPGDSIQLLEFVQVRGDCDLSPGDDNGRNEKWLD